MQNKKEALDFYNSLISESPFGIVTIDQDFIVTLINPNALLFLGLQGGSELYEDTNILSFIPSRKLKNRISESLEIKGSTFKLKNVAVNNRFLNFNAKNTINGLIINIIDVTENVLLRSKATQSLLSGQEKERKRLAREIHDGIGPALSSIKLQIDWLANKNADQEVTKKLQNISQNISLVATEIRQISHALMPSSLMDFGIVSALKNMVSRLNESGKTLVLFDTNLIDLTLPKNLELNLYRIVQELVSNALKYSKCTEIQIQLYQLEKRIQLSVYDDGIGIQPGKSEKGLGMENINTRVKAFRGVFEIDSQPGHGVNANISIPIKREI